MVAYTPYCVNTIWDYYVLISYYGTMDCLKGEHMDAKGRIRRLENVT